MSFDLFFRGLVLPVMGIWAAVTLGVNVKLLWTEMTDREEQR